MKIAQLLTTSSSSSSSSTKAALWGYLHTGGPWVDFTEADYFSGRFGQHRLQLIARGETLILLEMDKDGSVHDLPYKHVGKTSGDTTILGEAKLLGGELVTLFLNTEKNTEVPKQYIGIGARRPYTPPKTGAWAAAPAPSETGEDYDDEVSF